MIINGDFSSYYYYIFFISIFSALLIHFVIKSLSKSRRPPSPPAFPIIGHLHLLGSKLPQTLEFLSRRYGSSGLMNIKILGSTFLVASDASLAEQILKTDDSIFASKFVFGASHFMIYKNDSFVNSSYGTYWRFMKKLCVTKLFAGPQLGRFSDIREQETSKLLRTLMTKSEQGKACDLSMELQVMANNVICRMAMGKRWKENPDLAMEIRRLIIEIMKHGSKLSFLEVFGPLKKLDFSGNGKKLMGALWDYDGFIEKIIKMYENKEEDEHEEEEGEMDVMDILLQTQKDVNAGIELTRDRIKNFFYSILQELFMAGVDTTAATIEWAMLELINHPQEFETLRKEIESALGFDRRPVKESDISSLPYLQAVVKETMRIHPSGPLLRRTCNQDTTLRGYDVKKGTNIFINAYAIMRNPSFWKDPEKFVPERFLTEDRVGSKGQDFNFLPFGSGRRVCVGESHASIVTHTTLGSLVQCFDWKVRDGEKVDIEVVSGYTAAMAHSLVCFPIARFDPFK